MSRREEIAEEVLKDVRAAGIKFARLQFVDINGILKSVSVNVKNLERIFHSGQNFDGSSVTGYRPIEESDLILFPDPSTYGKLPGRPDECRLICDIYSPDGKRFECDPRYALQRALEKCREAGYVYKCAPEMEFFLLKDADGPIPTPIDMAGYFDLHPRDLTEDLRNEIANLAQGFGIEVELSHHEVARGQHEIDFKYGEALRVADNAMTVKMLIKSVAAKNGFIATFMPKPFYGVNGSGMHVHQSFWSLDGRNAFFDDNPDTGFLSKEALYFIGGQIRYGREMSAVLSSWPNSYKRLIPGYEAPVYLAWGYRNRSPLIRVPDFRRRPEAARVEIRSPDPAGNPYLQFAVLCIAGLEGIKRRIEPPEPTDLNLYQMSREERERRGIGTLPESFGQSLMEMEKGTLVKEALGEALFKNFLDEKRKEWDLYRMQVSPWEVERYIRKL
ncbi:MAG: glutamine synthetase family protein [Candidatus Bathyarchaeia archaeon]